MVRAGFFFSKSQDKTGPYSQPHTGWEFSRKEGLFVQMSCMRQCKSRLEKDKMFPLCIACVWVSSCRLMGGKAPYRLAKLTSITSESLCCCFPCCFCSFMSRSTWTFLTFSRMRGINIYVSVYTKCEEAAETISNFLTRKQICCWGKNDVKIYLTTLFYLLKQS